MRCPHPKSLGCVPSPGRHAAVTVGLAPTACSFPDRVLAFLLPKLESSNERTRVGTLLIMRQIINSAREYQGGCHPAGRGPCRGLEARGCGGAPGRLSPSSHGSLSVNPLVPLLGPGMSRMRGRARPWLQGQGRRKPVRWPGQLGRGRGTKPSLSGKGSVRDQQLENIADLQSLSSFFQPLKWRLKSLLFFHL